ncbi:type III secretion system chaperone [Thalassoglobus sp. JC818]|uniref:type III secretion system chaperone n=1 Tax=Thalassoglobus sp. JC818 TaxID=3232136 RepID=UPI003457F835
MTVQIDADQIEKDIMVLKDVTLSRQSIDDLMQSLGEMIGVEEEGGLALDDDGIVEVIVDNDVELTIAHLPHLPGVVVAAPMPEEAASNAQVLRYALRMNLNWMNIEGGCFSFVEPYLAMCKFIPLHQGTAAKLDQELARFIGKSKQWKALFKNMVSQLPHSEDSPSEFSESEECVGLRV